MLCCRSAIELRNRDPEDLGRWGTMLSLDNEARSTYQPLCHKKDTQHDQTLLHIRKSDRPGLRCLPDAGVL